MIPFGFKNAPATFQRVMDIILSTVQYQYALVYFDNKFSFSETPKDHIAHTRLTPHLLKRPDITLNLKNCALFTNRIEYLGHVIKPVKLEKTNHTADVILKLQVPITATELIFFVGLCNIFEQFVPNFAKNASPHSTRLRKSQASELRPCTKEKLSGLENLKKKLFSPPIFTLPKSNGQ